MIMFIIATFIGPALGPVASGYLELKKDWRWTFYMLLWLAGFTELLLLGLPETLKDAILVRMAKKIRKENSDKTDVKAPAEASDRTLLEIYNRGAASDPKSAYLQHPGQEHVTAET